MTKDFLLPLVPRSFFFLHLGPDLSDMPAKSGLAFPLTTDGADGIYKALHRGSVSGCCISTHCRRICLLSHLLERLSQRKSATGQSCCYQRRAGKISCDCPCWEDKVSPESNWGKEAAPLCSVCSLWPSSWVVWSPPPSDALGASQGLAMISRPISCLPQGGWAELQSWMKSYK